MSIFDKFSRKKSDSEKSEEIKVQEEKVEELLEEKTATENESNEQKKEGNYKKGTDFENYALSLFPEDAFSMVQRAISFDPLTGRRMEGCLNPDFKLRDKNTGAIFWVECKYRSHTNPDKSLTWCTYEKMMKYKDIREKTNLNVYIIIGLGGSPSDPAELFCFNLDDMKYSKMYQSVYMKYNIDKKAFYSLDNLNKRINH
ncbi:hypothetical protein [Candidatus Methanomassiliicoccus intestinalis]|uniref:Uncharacterized protein n=1 Tax=Methanomassiliicoccus intestinalis (strain Issoire-Mx1) TaxID=1295009 RepID=R9T8T8_METII|nr:hypothetical protein [Candidatus Methanomassiliicoccus intestinalis]AGN27110.1 hypothetical protein MMINT_18310 [Candidatus Methanomassiliicoccus intestinalis Issoire-Mx1]TQS80922.1 MAG: hypothetical protein A3206_04295 [Candidatus Methanomassiliicoccus intestinalis]